MIHNSTNKLKQMNCEEKLDVHLSENLKNKSENENKYDEENNSGLSGLSIENSKFLIKHNYKKNTFNSDYIDETQEDFNLNKKRCSLLKRTLSEPKLIKVK